jgi:hypothetical protein
MLTKSTMSSAAAIVCAVVLTGPHVSANQIITMHSGNGIIGGVDSDISMLVGPADTAFVSFAAGDFVNARGGQQAHIINRHPLWLAPSSFSDPTANWISTSSMGASEGSSALFAIDFTITDAIVTSADIVFNFAADNRVGGLTTDGLFLNGVALSGNTSGTGFASEITLTRNDIAPLLTTGLNTLYINLSDGGGPSGLLFSTTITTVGSTPGTPSIPEPGTLALFGLGLAGLVLARRRKATA